jgi:hypothetical protein
MMFCGLTVAMGHASAMGAVEGIGDLEFESLIERERALLDCGPRGSRSP